jgi:hypothetical protein
MTICYQKTFSSESSSACKIVVASASANPSYSGLGAKVFFFIIILVLLMPMRCHIKASIHVQACINKRTYVQTPNVGNQIATRHIKDR